MEMGGALDDRANNSLIPFIFVGSNTTLPHPPNLTVELNLEDIATLFIPANFSLTGSGRDCKGTIVPKLVSVLLCDPHFILSPATVNLTGSALQAVIHPGSPVVRNIPVQAANIIFSRSLLDTTSSTKIWPTLVNDIACVLSFADCALNYTGNL